MKVVQLLVSLTLLVIQSMSKSQPLQAYSVKSFIDPGGLSHQEPATCSESHPPWSRSVEFQMTCSQLSAHGAIVPDEPYDAAETYFRRILILSITLSVIVSISTFLRVRFSLRGLHSPALVRQILTICFPLAKASQYAFKS